MRNIMLTRLAFSCFLLFLIKGYSQTHSTPINRSTIKAYELKQGKHLVAFDLNASKKIDVSLSVPDLKPGEKVPLIIALHWAGNPTAYRDYSECLAFPALEFMNGIIVAPSDHGLHWVNEINDSKLMQLITKIIKHWPIDTSKIIITGYSNGGIGSWYYAQKYPEIFKAAIPISGMYEAAKIEIPVYIIHGKKDELFNVYRVQNMVSQSIEKGSLMKLKLLENYSHYMGCAYTEALQTIARQVEKEVFND